MGDTKIEYVDRTWNPITGCTHAGSPGCDHCWARRMAKRLRGRLGYPADDPFRITLHPERLDEPLHWRKPRLVFVCSMGDLGHEDIVGIQYTPDNPYNPNEPVDEDGCKRMDFAIKVIQTISRCYWHTFIILTKRPEGLKFLLECAKENGDYWPQTPKQVAPGIIFNRRDDFLSNLWLGVTAENQEQADKRIPILLQIPAAVRFVSVEPMLGAVDLYPFLGQISDSWEIPDRPPDLSWVICGMESLGNRPGRIFPRYAEAIRNLKNQCVEASIPFFFKQAPNSLFDTAETGQHKMVKMPELDGQIYNQLPGV